MLHMRIFNWLAAKIFLILSRNAFNSIGVKSKIISPIAIEGAKNISIGNGVLVAAQSCLAAVPLTGGGLCQLEIGDGCMIGRFNHIYATKSIIFEKNVLTANNVYITDNLHDYEDPELPIMNQPIVQRGSVIIGEGSWLGHNACIIGARIGRHCVVGANAVVTKDVPDFCVVAGIPAEIIKRYDEQLKVWRRTCPNGRFVDV
jgi:acetyltransferase-like isoleucine patch superfamily enzyme